MQKSSLPKKVVITSKMLTAAPQHMILLNKVAAKSSVKPETFQAQIPEGAMEVQIQQDDSESIREGNW